MANLMLHWKLDHTGGNTTAVDSSGNSYDGTLTNITHDADGAAGKFGRAIQFADTINEKILGPDDDTFRFTGDVSFSVALWVYIGAAYDANGEAWCGTTRVTGDWDGWRVEITPTGALQFWANNAGAVAGYDYVANQGLNDEKWHHIVWTFDHTLDKPTDLYVDGSEVATLNWKVAQPTAPGAGNARFAVGSQGETDIGTSKASNSILDDVRIYSGVLSAADVAALQNPYGVGSTGLRINSGLSISI